MNQGEGGALYCFPNKMSVCDRKLSSSDPQPGRVVADDEALLTTLGSSTINSSAR